MTKRFRLILALGMLLGTAVGSGSGSSFAAGRPERAVVRNTKGDVIEYLTESLGGGYVRRGPGGIWLGRASLEGDTYRFYDKVGRTVWFARPELQPLGTTRRALATVRDTSGQLVGIITAQ